MKIFLIFLVSADNVCWRSFIDTCRCNTDFTGCALSYPILSYTIQSYPILSNPILSYPILSNSILPNPIQSHTILSYPILYYPILSYPILSNPILSYPILYYPILSYPILYYPILSYPILSYTILSYPIPFTPKRSGEDGVLYTLLDKLFYFLSNAVTFFQLSVFFNDFSFICR